MVAYPICILGARAEEEDLRGIAMGGLLATSLGSLLNTLVITVACLALHQPALILIVVGATIFWQLQETLRTVFTARQAFRRSLPGDAVSYLGQAFVLGLICIYRIPGLTTIFFVVLGTSAIAAVAQCLQIRPRHVDRLTMNSFLSEMWQLGKWSTLARCLAFFTSQALPWLLAYSSGVSSVASYQSLFQLVALANPLLLGFNTIISASIAGQKRVTGGTTWAASVKQMRLAAMLLGSYYSVLALFGPMIMKLFFGIHSPYLANAPLLRYCALAAGLEVVAMLAGAVLGGLGETRSNFVVQLCATATSVLIVFPFIVRFGLKAAVLGLIGIAATRAVVAFYLSRAALEKNKIVGLHDINSLA